MMLRSLAWEAEQTRFCYILPGMRNKEDRGS